MPVTLFDSEGKGHDLSKGAFDSESLAKRGMASTYLSKYIGQRFSSSFDKLLIDYHQELEDAEPTVAQQLWDTVGKSAGQALLGSYQYSRPMAQRWIAEIARNHPTVAGLVAAAEAVMARTISYYSTPQAKSISLGKGQWLFIESETHYRRRMLKGETAKKPPPEPTIKAVSLGFFIENAFKSPNKVNVFNFDLGRAQTVDVRQIRETGIKVGGQLDRSEKLSAIRELFFYKKHGDEYDQTGKDVYVPGKKVVFEGREYIVIYREGENALLEDGVGHTRVAPIDQLGVATARTSTGKQDKFFNSASVGHFYAGQWVYVPSRSWVREDYDTDTELAVVFRVHGDNTITIFYTLDGEKGVASMFDSGQLRKDIQQGYNAKWLFGAFRSAAIEGIGTDRVALGSDFAAVCAAKTDDTISDPGYIPKGRPTEPDKPTKKGPEAQGPTQGNLDAKVIDKIQEEEVIAEVPPGDPEEIIVPKTKQVDSAPMGESLIILGVGIACLAAVMM